MLKYSREFALNWCEANGWTDFFTEQYRYWAFPPGAVMPLPLPPQALQIVSEEKILNWKERLLYTATVVCTGVTAGTTCWLRSPLPLTFAFVFCAIAVVLVEEG
uniref:Uncharacterized protein n=1 Tax=Cyanothece sp. (strain PCC 7425 / ATCC 29141) TaxID=395961 RepID=B8HUG5_CYAP4